MKHIQIINNFQLGVIAEMEKNKEVKEIHNGDWSRLISVELREGALLPKHKSSEPITIFCLAGAGTLRAGRDLNDEQKLGPGTLVALEAGIEHEVLAESDLSLLVTKFKPVGPIA